VMAPRNRLHRGDSKIRYGFLGVLRTHDRSGTAEYAAIEAEPGV
jgi:hypothetical protein